MRFIQSWSLYKAGESNKSIWKNIFDGRINALIFLITYFWSIF